MSRLKVPVVCTVIGEGGSGGALAIGVGDKVNMLQYSTYSVISPEAARPFCGRVPTSASGCRSDGHHCATPERTETDRPHPEPLGGAHRNPEAMAASLKAQLLADLADLDVLSQKIC